MLLPFLLSVAHAGKLANGWRGHLYGDATWLASPPSEGCTPTPEVGVRWLCPESVGGAKVEVNYMLATEIGGAFTGIVLRCEGYLVCAAVLDTLMAAWGKPFRTEEYGTLPDRTWADGSVLAGWEYNQFSDIGTATTFDKVLYERIKVVEASKAQDAAGEL
jgi:hypothetical protein